MTQVVYGQKGYLGSSMSVRAAEAYEQGEMPISRWTKTAIIQAVKAYRWNRVYSAGQDARVHFEKAIRRDDQG